MRARLVNINEDLLGNIDYFAYGSIDLKKFKRFKVYKNPRSIKRMGPNMRAISDKEGDLYVVDDNGEYLVHSNIREWLQEKGFMFTKYKRFDIDIINWQRYEHTNDFYLAESYFESDIINHRHSFDRLMKKVKQRNPQYNFIMQNIIYFSESLDN